MVTLPLRTVSEANARGHWSRRAKRAKGQRHVAGLALRSQLAGAPLPVVVTLTRIAPRMLDDDNLRGALKAVRDGVADALGLDDRDVRATWVYVQERRGVGQYAVEIQVAPRAQAPAARFVEPPDGVLVAGE